MADPVSPTNVESRACAACGYSFPSHTNVCPECGQVAAAQPLLKRLGPAAILGAIAIIAPPLGTIGLFAAMALTDLGPWLKSHGTNGAIAYAFSFAVLTGLALLPTYSQSALGGFAFGITLGIPAALAGFAGGAIIGYEIACRASGDRVMRLVDEKPKWRIIRDALVGPRVGGGPLEVPPRFWRTVGLVALLRVPPNSPFALTNLVMASVKVPRVPFLIGTVIGMAPRTSVAVIIGASLNSFTRDSLKEAAPSWVWGLGIGVLVVVCMIVGHIAKRAIERAAAANNSVA